MKNESQDGAAPASLDPRNTLARHLHSAYTRSAVEFCDLSPSMRDYYYGEADKIIAMVAPVELPRPTTAPAAQLRAFCCEKKSKCTWQGFALHQGLGWGSPEDHLPEWVGAHKRECGGRLIQITTPQEESRGEPGEVKTLVCRPGCGWQGEPEETTDDGNGGIACPKCEGISLLELPDIAPGAPEEAPSPAPAARDYCKILEMVLCSISGQLSKRRRHTIIDKFSAQIAAPMEVQPRDPMDDNESLDPRYGTPHSLHIMKPTSLDIDGQSYRVESAVWEKVGQQHHSLMENHRIIRAIRANLRALCEGLKIENLEAAVLSTPENLKWLGQQIRERAEAGVRDMHTKEAKPIHEAPREWMVMGEHVPDGYWIVEGPPTGPYKFRVQEILRDEGASPESSKPLYWPGTTKSPAEWPTKAGIDPSDVALMDWLFIFPTSSPNNLEKAAWTRLKPFLVAAPPSPDLHLKEQMGLLGQAYASNLILIHDLRKAAEKALDAIAETLKAVSKGHQDWPYVSRVLVGADHDLAIQVARAKDRPQSPEPQENKP